MRQVLQSLRTGVTEVAVLPAPSVRRGRLLIRVSTSVISIGTERMLVEFGRANLLQKARSQPDRVKMVLQKVRTDGLWPTIDSVRSKLDEPLALGYSNAGVVVEVGAGVEGFQVGDRVISNGSHAELVAVPANLCAKIPDGVDDESAAFTVISSVALQGVRLAQVALGENVAVIGLGLIGLIAVQLLKAQGCRVLGIDFDARKLELARRFGAETVDLANGQDPVTAGMQFSGGHGVDAVLIAAATTSNEPMHQAALMSRKRGRIILIGGAGLNLSRADFYEKELSFQVSCSYGPGRYDAQYEEKGIDYPVGLVRWTEQRNFEAILDLAASGALDFGALISHRFPIEKAADAYNLLAGGKAGLGIMLTYGNDAAQTDELKTQRTLTNDTPRATAVPGEKRLRVAVLGAGTFASRVMIPNLTKTPSELEWITSGSGVPAYSAARKFGFRKMTTDSAAPIADPNVDAILIATRPDTHVRFAVDALRSGKHVFIEKPMAIDHEGLIALRDAYHAAAARKPVLAVGFNRRFAPQTLQMRDVLGSVNAPRLIVMTVNAGFLPADHWANDLSIGGGRLIGEGCHFVDLARFLVGHPVTETQIAGTLDSFSLTMKYADGSIATLHYFSNGHGSFPKERIEVICNGGILQLDNFRTLRASGFPSFRKSKLSRQDKGHAACLAAFIKAARTGGGLPAPLEELIEVHQVCFDANQKLMQQA